MWPDEDTTLWEATCPLPDAINTVDINFDAYGRRFNDELIVTRRQVVFECIGRVVQDQDTRGGYYHRTCTFPQ